MPGLRKRTRPPSSRCRTQASRGPYGQGWRSASYTPNNLNQYTSRTVPGGFDVVGVANNTATVRMDGNDVQYRRNEYWRQYVSVDSAGVPVWRRVSVTTTGGGSATGGMFVAKTAEAFGYDLDGNLTSDGRWTYVWNGENRLIRMVANTSVEPQQRIEYEYDWQGRRIGKKVWDNTQGTGNPSLTRKFLYDGWNLIAELDGNNTLLCSYVWGLDLSGSFQGAVQFGLIPKSNLKISMLTRNGFRIAFVLSISPMSLHDLWRSMIFEGIIGCERDRLLLAGLTDLCRVGLLAWSFEPDYGNKPAIKPCECDEKRFLNYWHEFIEKSDLSVQIPDSQNPTLSLEGTPALNEEVDKACYNAWRREIKW